MNLKLLEDLYKAYYDARRHKRNTINQLEFELRLEDNLLELYHQLEDRTYKVGRSVAFIIESPVKREVFVAAEGCGLPIGNLTSQLFSNVYLNDFDQYVKRTLKMKHYGRYVDDFFLVHPSMDVLKEAIVNIRSYLKETISVVVHPKKIYLQPVERGISYIGAYIKPHRTYASRRTVAHFKQLLHDECSYSSANSELLGARINSYLGFLQHYSSYTMRNALLDAHPWVFNYGCADKDRTKYLSKELLCASYFKNIEKVQRSVAKKNKKKKTKATKAMKT